jgi:pimeloyl-ACP methyl ester carboxylesterase
MTRLATHSSRSLISGLFRQKTAIKSAWILTVGLLCPTAPVQAEWEKDPSSWASIEIEPVREEALSWYHPRSLDGHADSPLPAPLPLRLALKRYPRPGAQPVLLVHGLSQNDRGLDSRLKPYSFARYLHSRGFDVWVGNMRNAGTPDFESETPPGPNHWTVEDYAVDDFPALVDHVADITRKRPFLLGHSLAAWIMDGWLAGLEFDRFGGVVPNPIKAASRRLRVKGLITVAGLYGLEWEKRLKDWKTNPLRTEQDYYHSNYELELLARAEPLYWFLPRLPSLPLGWLQEFVSLPLGDIPFVGDQLDRAYRHLSDRLIGSPVFNMFFYAPNTDPEMVRSHLEDGMEAISPKLLEQIANAQQCGRRTTFHPHRLGCDVPAYDYSLVRRDPTAMQIPQLMVAGDRDRLASAHQIRTLGYELSRDKGRARDITYRVMDAAGHLDILGGLGTEEGVFKPVADWMNAR